ncbi:histone-lysine N-methyltransferase 2D-like protein [Lates japonicus]|uniref:Histone-lysine N-methyltransferase 2D-like protein n=1 Tax=Lates japonicus TaxID=270547 RepID=A0AAD3M761_LATJO|nr:histone-lysine N-methyltransferase 2D-like protein [Lates japonicus]
MKQRNSQYPAQEPDSAGYNSSNSCHHYSAGTPDNFLLSTAVLRTPWTTQRKSQLQAHTTWMKQRNSQHSSSELTLLCNSSNSPPDNTEEEPTSPTTRLFCPSPPPALLPLSTTPANTGPAEAGGGQCPTPEPDFAVVPAPPTPSDPLLLNLQSLLQYWMSNSQYPAQNQTRCGYNSCTSCELRLMSLSHSAVQNDQTTSAEPLTNFVVHNGLNKSLTCQKSQLLPANQTLLPFLLNSKCLVQNQTLLWLQLPTSCEPCWMSLLSSLVQDDLTASAETLLLTCHPQWFWNNSLDEAEEEPTASPNLHSLAPFSSTCPLTLYRNSCQHWPG